MPAFEPNVVLPLAASYNTRGIVGYTNLVTNGLDQRKINLVYRPVKNALTGKTTLYLCKRPGVLVDAGSFGTTGQVAYLVDYAAGGTGSSATDQVWVYSTDSDDVRVSSSATTTVVVSAAGNVPLYVDHFHVGGADNAILQVGSDYATQTVWYSTAIATWSDIENGDSDFPDVIGKMEFMDGYAFAAAQSVQVQRIYNSDLNSISSWTSTNFITKQIQQDSLQGLMRLGNLLLACGQQTMEVFRNAGNASGSPLESMQQLSQNVGINPSSAGGHYYCTVGNRIYFYARTGGSATTSICSFDGARIEPVSTPNIDAIINTRTRFGIYAIHFQGRQAVACSLEATSATTQRWLLFFPDYNEWFEWHSAVFCPVNSSIWFLGVGANQHKLYQFVSTDNWQDNEANFDATMQFALPSKGNQRKSMHFCALTGDTPSSSTSITVKKKDNDESSWVTLGTIELATAKKAIIRCGSWEGQRQIQLINSNNNEGRIETFLARID